MMESANIFIVKSILNSTGLKLAIHAAEVPNPVETEALLGGQVTPDRIGHGTFIHHEREGGSQKLWNMLLSALAPF